MQTSLIIVSFNGWDDLQRCLASVYQNPVGPDEIIVVDNASQDQSVDNIRSEFPKVHLIESSINLGFSEGCNLGSQEAQGEILIFLNQDTLVSPGWLEALTWPLINEPGVGLVTPKILLLEQPDRINTCGNNVHISGLTMCRGMDQPSKNFSLPAVVTAISGAAFAIRRDCFRQLGGFDKVFFTYMEDTDLSLRAQLAGFYSLFTPASVVFHNYTLSFGPRKVFFQERNRYFTLLKLYDWKTFILLFPILLLAEVVTWGFVILQEPSRFMNKLEAYQWIWTHWPLIMGSRKEAQKIRKVKDRVLLRRANTWLQIRQSRKGWIPVAAELIFNPIFYILKQIALLLIWW